VGSGTQLTDLKDKMPNDQTFQNREEYNQALLKMLANAKMTAHVELVSDTASVTFLGDTPPAYFKKHHNNRMTQFLKRDESVLRLRQKLQAKKVAKK